MALFPEAPHSENIMAMKKVNTPLLLAIAFFSVTVLAFEAYAFWLWQASGVARLPGNFGNFERTRAMLKPPVEPGIYSFAVVGDTQRGDLVFQNICRLLAREPLSFMIHLGDLAVNGTEGYHRLVKYQWARGLSLPFPTFLAAGNHDVDAARFPPKRFEEEYGPSNFWFTHGGDLFVVLRMIEEDPEGNDAGISFLENTLKTESRRAKRTFVFLHTPPPVFPDIERRTFQGSDRFFRLCDQFGIDYVFSGHYHGYLRAERHHTAYLVSGGGGGPLETKQPGTFHHAVVISVTPQRVLEQIVGVSGDYRLVDKVHGALLGKVVPRALERPALLLLANAVLAFGAVAAMWGLRVSRRDGKKHNIE